MEREYVVLRDPLPALAVYTVKVDVAAAVGIAEGGLVDGATAEIAGLLDGQVGAVPAVEDAIGVHGTRAHGKHIATHPVPFRVHIIEPCKKKKREKKSVQHSMAIAPDSSED